MATLNILTGVDNETLRKKSKPIKKANKEIKKLAVDMMDTMMIGDGLGLAAPQIGVNLRMIVVRMNFQTKNEMIVPMINPEILKVSEKMVCAEEGCLSIPKKFVPVKRAAEITVKYRNLHFEEHVLNLHSMNARVIQHEIDHLDGILMVDRMESDLSPAAIEREIKG
ncbi:MAG: peptide deformylase [Candidatus Gracilibacteria bacterium]|jgi:peptide deformylase